ncbi:hypothetical protein ESCOCP358B2_24170 [Escherichia coli]
MQGCEMNSNRLAAPVIFEDSSGCYPVCIKNPDIMGNITASTTRKCRKRKLTAVCSHQTRIGNLDAHLI